MKCFASLPLTLGCEFCSCADPGLALERAVWISCWSQGSLEVCEIVRLSSWILHYVTAPNGSTDGKDGFLLCWTKCSMNRFGSDFTANWAYVMWKGYRPTLSLSKQIWFYTSQNQAVVQFSWYGKGTLHTVVRYLCTYRHNWTQQERRISEAAVGAGAAVIRGW